MLSYSSDLKDRAAVDDPLAVPGHDVEAALIVEQVAQVLAGIPAIGWPGAIRPRDCETDHPLDR